MTTIVDQTIIDTVVDDVELLTILGIPPKIAVLDWNDMPELDEDIDDDKESVVSSYTGKRRYNDDEENVFNQFDFIEVPIVTEKQEKEPESKKRKLSFVENEDFNDFKINLENDIQLALELTCL